MAYAFNCDLSLEQQLRELRAGTGWTWHERDSAFWGDYISASASLGVIVKIFEEGAGYLLELKFQDEGLGSDWEPAANAVLEQLTPLIGAREVRPATSNN